MAGVGPSTKALRVEREAPIELVPYSPAWPARFASEAAMLREALKPWLVADLEHIGSTAVPGLVAKPVVDIMGPVADLQASVDAIGAAQRVGYCYFPYKSEQMHWFCKPSPEARTHHLHLVPYDSALWHDRLAFRDALRGDARLSAQYRELKLELAARHRQDREAYTDGKSSFVQAVLGARCTGRRSP
jgi:GrpB-like predicted nucleotidyltransferase (UPF0157 family)